MSKQIFQLGGLPRSGSTLLMNLLAQNPRIHATATSGLLEVLFATRNRWWDFIEHNSNTELAEKRLPQVLNGIMQSYYADVDEPIVVDKSRGWISLLEMLEYATGEEPNIVVPVRDVRDILASFEKLYRANQGRTQTLGEKEAYFQMQTVEGRCDFLLREDQPVGLAINRVRDVIARGNIDKVLIIDYDDFCKEPAEGMKAIYDFWGALPFMHDFRSIKQVTKEDDTVHGINGLHDIKNSLEKSSTNWQEVLGNVGNKYSDIAKFWL